MKKVISIFCVMMLCFCLTACDNSKTNEGKQTKNESNLIINDSNPTKNDGIPTNDSNPTKNNSNPTNNDIEQINQHEAPRSDTKQETDDVGASKTLSTIDLSITVGNKEFSAKLYDNQTTQALVKRFPLTVDMSELNGNEKYCYLSDTLPTASEQPGEIHAGDIMLYGDNCLVVFYETFSSSYKYTRLGYIEDAAGFAQVVSDGNIKDADVIVFATPIYYYEMSGQMKTLLDRLNPLFPSDYSFREVYMIAAAADNNPEAMDVAVKGLQGWIACFDKAKLSGVIRGIGVTDTGNIQHNKKLMSEAYKMGKAI